MPKNIILSLIITFFFAGLFFSLTKPVLAEQEEPQFGVKNPLTDDFTKDLAPEKLFSRILKTVLGIVGVMSLLTFIRGGFVWMTAGGNDEKVKQGRDTLLWAMLALAVIFSAYAILHVVITTLMGVTYQ